MNYILESEHDALGAARAYYALKYPALADSALVAMNFERGWLVGPAKNDPSVSGQLGVTLLVVDRNGTIEESSSSVPPKQIITNYLTRHET